MEGLQSFKLYYEECNQFALILPVSFMQALRSWKACNYSSSTMKNITRPPWSCLSPPSQAIRSWKACNHSSSTLTNVTVRLDLAASTMEALRSWKACNDLRSTMKNISSPPWSCLSPPCRRSGHGRPAMIQALLWRMWPVRLDLACLHHSGAQVVEGLQLFKLYYEECNQFALILPVSTMQVLRSWKACNYSSTTMKNVTSSPWSCLSPPCRRSGHARPAMIQVLQWRMWRM
jgi:hypothetical protein